MAAGFRDLLAWVLAWKSAGGRGVPGLEFTLPLSRQQFSFRKDQVDYQFDQSLQQFALPALQFDWQFSGPAGYAYQQASLPPNRQHYELSADLGLCEFTLPSSRCHCDLVDVASKCEASLQRNRCQLALNKNCFHLQIPEED